jgi:hypothetical protein
MAAYWDCLEREKADGVFTNFDHVVAKRIREFCAKDLRTRLLVGTRINPLNWPRLTRDFFAVSAEYLAAQ